MGHLDFYRFRHERHLAAKRDQEAAARYDRLTGLSADPDERGRRPAQANDARRSAADNIDAINRRMREPRKERA